MVLVSLVLLTAPGGCRWNLAIAAVPPRSRFPPARLLRACIFLSQQTRYLIVRRRCRDKPTMRISCSINAAARCPPLNPRLFLTLLSHLRHSNRTVSVKAVSRLRLVSCRLMTPMSSLVLLLMESHSFPTSVWVCYLIRPMRRQCRHVCNIPILTKVANVRCHWVHCLRPG